VYFCDESMSDTWNTSRAHRLFNRVFGTLFPVSGSAAAAATEARKLIRRSAHHDAHVDVPVPMSSTTSEPDANSAQALARSLKAPLNAVSLDAKLDVAVWLVAADERTCIFPDRLRFVLDWLCGVLRGAKAGSDGVPPRADVRFWRLLDALLHRAAGLPEPIDDAAPPAQLPRPLPSGFRTRLAQSSRLLLQSAAAALEHAAAGSMAPSASAHLCARVRRVSCLLLIEEASWFRPGAEAVAEYAGRVSQSAALLLEGSASPYATVREAMAAGAPHALHAAADASSAVAALTGETPPRKVLMILTGTLLRPMLALLSSCSRLFGSGADEEADDGGGAHHGATHSGSFRARDGASRALVCAAVDAAAVISESVRSILVHADHLPEYAATLRHSMPTPEAALSLGGSERTGAAGREISIAPSSSGSSSGKRAPKRAKAEAPSGGGGSANYTAATLEAIARFTRDDLQSAPARALSRALAAASAAGAVPGATPSVVPGATLSAVPGARLANGSGGGGGGVAADAAAPAALLLPVLPALLEWIASAYEQQQAVMREERSTRLRLGLISGSRTPRAVTADGGARDGADAPAEAPTTAEGSSLELGFGLLAWLATPLLGSLTALLGDTLAALGADDKTGLRGGRCMQPNDETGLRGDRCMQPKVEARAQLELAATVRLPSEALLKEALNLPCMQALITAPLFPQCGCHPKPATRSQPCTCLACKRSPRRPVPHRYDCHPKPATRSQPCFARRRAAASTDPAKTYPASRSDGFGR